jgi:hypothetical protein
VNIEFLNWYDMNVVLHIAFFKIIANQNKENFNVRILKEEFSLRNIDIKLEKNIFNWKKYIKKKNINTTEVESDSDENEEKNENIVDRIFLPVNKYGNYKGYGFVYYRPCISGEIV